MTTLSKNGKPIGRPRQTHCYKGHPLIGEGVYRMPNGYVACRKCTNDRAARRRERVRTKKLIDAGTENAPS